MREAVDDLVDPPGIVGLPFDHPDKPPEGSSSSGDTDGTSRSLRMRRTTSDFEIRCSRASRATAWSSSSSSMSCTRFSIRRSYTLDCSDCVTPVRRVDEPRRARPRRSHDGRGALLVGRPVALPLPGRRRPCRAATSRSSGSRTPRATRRRSATSTSGRAPSATSRRCSGATTRPSASRRGRRAGSTTWATSRSPRRTTTSAASSGSRTSSRAPRRPERPRWRSAATTRSPAGIVQGLASEGSKLTGDRKVALLHLDAHIDAYESIPHWLGAKKSAAHWASYLVRQGQVDPARSVQIGIRGNPRTADWLEPSYELGYEVIPIDRYRELGAERCIELIRERVGDAPRVHHVRSRLPRPVRRAGRLESRARVHGLHHGRGTPAAPGDAREGGDRRRRRLPHADEGLAQPDHGPGRRGDHVRADRPDRRPARAAG